MSSIYLCFEFRIKFQLNTYMDDQVEIMLTVEDVGFLVYAKK